MAKKNIYDYIISELIYSNEQNLEPAAPYLEVVSNLPFNNVVNANYNGSVQFTSTVKNIPADYTVKTNTHTMTYPIMFGPDVSSAIVFVGSFVPLIFTSLLDTFPVDFAVTLEHPTLPDINLTFQFVITATDIIYFGTHPNDTTFNTLGFESTSYLEVNQKVIFSSAPVFNEYVYFVFPLGASLPLFLRDRNGLIIDLTDFNFTVYGSAIYMILGWDTMLPSPSQWELVYTL
jgi:hypothetical protein